MYFKYCPSLHGADLEPKSRNESNGRRVKIILTAQIFKCYGLENVGVGQIGILSHFLEAANSAPGE